ncbi:hypothetical protein [Corallococcus macrosporus]|uniref:Putative lipoprotein n=1 Tax=Myxococcus fulvus (strain ATCC BAA-855 / HW-1) TaxID=483219 RepID=F8CMR0_MYXFH|nr:hypothetical protein [Corallococcus macrosporus]AEI66532.1 putative lipoprotein [Corallococcus macrosporus]
MALGSPRLLAVSSLLLFALSGCGIGVPEEETPPVGTQAAEIRIANALTTRALVLNAIATNHDSNSLLGTTALQALFHPTSGDANTRRRLHDANAQRFMEYVVGCALREDQQIHYYDPRPGSAGVRQWRGQAGLCPMWATNPPSEDCLERVSACVLARNNAEGRRVELSMRGEHRFSASGPNIYTLDAKTRPATHVPITGVAMASFDACGLGESGAQRDCGWTPDGVGSCVPASTVFVGAGGPLSCAGPSATLGSSVNGPAVLRVCEGTAGCEHLDARNLGEATGTCAGAPAAPVVSFTCPAGGYYSVMTAPASSTTVGLVANVAAHPAWASTYGLSEQQVYAVREGAFYGNIFLPDELAAEVEVVEYRDGKQSHYKVEGADVIVAGSIYKKMFSCFDPAWSSGAAYAANRVCALPNLGANCAARVTGPCFASLQPPVAGQCDIQDGPLTPGDGDYEQCRDHVEVLWTQSVTTYLHAPCDTVTRERSTKEQFAQACGRGAVPLEPSPPEGELPWPFYPRKK